MSRVENGGCPAVLTGTQPVQRACVGAAVAAGMCAAARLGVRLGVTPAELPERLEEALSALGLPTAIPCTAEDYAAAVGLDKKGAGEDISVILLERMGRAVPHRMPKAKLLEELR